MSQDVETRLSVHEAVCAERYKAIESHLVGLNRGLMMVPIR